VYSVDVYERMGGLNTIGHPGMAHHHSAQTVAMADSLTGDPEPTQMATLPTYGLGANPDADNQADLTVNVLGMQYAWIFTYPDQGITTGELHVALGQDVQLNITAQDVIHSLWVPQFRMKQDAIPGAPAELRFKATKVGTYPIVCTELCGSYHGSMRSQVIVHSPEEYDQWLSENQIAQKDNPPTLAVNPAALSNEEFLAPYSDAIGVHAEHLHAMQH
jgi:cytochrome c oxidase subunit 2